MSRHLHIQELLSRYPIEVVLESETLWPDPFAAPEVPDPRILSGYLSGDLFLHYDLTHQIEHSLPCLRALEAMLQDPDAALHMLPSEPLEVPSPRSVTAKPTAFAQSPLGKIHAVRNDYLWWDEEELTLRTGYNFQTTHVLLVSDPIMESAPYVRVIPCSPDLVWAEDMRSALDLPFQSTSGSGWVLHAWLGYPMSLDDLDYCVGQITPQELQRLQQQLSRTKDQASQETEDTPEPMWLYLEREQLIERTQTLCSTLDAYRLQAEAGESLFSLATEHVIPLPLAASSGEIASRIAIATTEESGVDHTTAVTSEAMQATLLESFPQYDDTTERGIIQWLLSSPLSQVREVYVLTEEKKILGRGRYHPADRTILLEAPWALLAPYSADLKKIEKLMLLLIL
jgi:hypothetical protein